MNFPIPPEFWCIIDTETDEEIHLCVCGQGRFDSLKNRSFPADDEMMKLGGKLQKNQTWQDSQGCRHALCR